MGYSYKNKKGQTYFLHERVRAGSNGKGKLFFFSKDEKESIKDIPEGYKIGENEKTGLPFLKKK